MSTKDDIQASINSRLKSAATRIEGGTAEDIIGSVAYELANIIDTRVDVILDNAFITTADYEHLKIRGEELGIYQKEASYAYVYAKITKAAENKLIEAGFKAYTDDGIEFQSIEDVITDGEGMGIVKMQCLQAGAQGNIAPDVLVNFYDEYEGLEGAEITNPNAGYDGFEAEEAEEYRARILEYIKDNAINSNIADYQKWATSVNGVKKAIVQDAFIAGAGKVNVYISAINNSSASDELIAAVKSKIKKEQIINADVNVYSLTPIDIDIKADIKIRSGKDIQEIKTVFANKLIDYLQSIDDNISYLYISNLLFGVDGVSDVQNYTLNEAETSMQLTLLQVPYLNSIELTEIEEQADES